MFLPKVAHWMPHKLCKFSAWSAQAGSRPFQKIIGGCTTPPPLHWRGLISGIYMLQFELLITCQKLLSSGRWFCTKKSRSSVQVMYHLGWFLTIQNLLISEKKRWKWQRIQNTTEPWHTTKKAISEIQKKTSSDISFSGFSPEALVFDELLG